MNTLVIPWWNRLGVRLATAIAFVSIITLSVFLLLVLRSQNRHLMDQARRSAAIVNDTITSSIEHDMLQDRREDAYQIMAGIARQDQVERLRLFDAIGRIRYSKKGSEIGTVPDIKAESCAPCHASGRSQLPLSVADRTHVTVRNGRHVLGAVTPIYNQPACSTASCHVHPTSQRVVGVVELGLQLDSIDQESATLRRTTMGLTLLATLTLAVLTFAFTRRLVIHPVRRLVAATKRVRAGKLDEHVPVSGTGEIGALERSFNEMERALATARAERNELLQGLERQVRERTEALERAQAQLIQTEKLSSLGKLSASIAHEINNPLAGILTTAKLLIRGIEEKPPDPAAAGTIRMLRLVQRETERCTAIVRNLLGFARERALTLTDADVNAALDEALFLVQNQFALLGIELDRVMEKVPPMRGDFGQLRQAFANIVINACDAMAKGGTLRVRTRFDQTERAIVVEIGDTGVGIPPEQLSKVLDPFFTTKEKGTGLGLSVVYGVVERHGGRLDIRSTPGQGTTVTIRLPLSGAESLKGEPAAAVPGTVHGAA
jgi:two-component system NtrC family sensor kinase